MDYKELQSFLVTVQEGSLSAAAKKLGIAQPTISMHLKNLEDELGTKLLVRNARTLDLTADGREAIDSIGQVVRIWDNLQKRLNGDTTKLISISASTIPSTYILPKVLPEYVKNFNDVYFSIHQSNSKDVAERVKGGLCDIGICGMRPTDKEMVYRELFTDKMVVITPVSEKYLKMQGTPFAAKDLLDEHIILREKGSGSGKKATDYFTKNHISESKLNVVARVNDQEGIKNLVAGGVGVSIISNLAARDYVAENRILSFELAGDSQARSFYLMRLKEKKVSGHLQQFEDFIVNFYSKFEA